MVEQTGRGPSTDFMGMCRHSLEDYLHQDAANVASTCEYPVPYNLEVISVLGHMHLRGKSIRIESNPSESDSQVILDIPDWGLSLAGWLYPTRTDNPQTGRHDTHYLCVG